MRNGLGIAALCCGLVGVAVGLIPLMFVLSGILGILAIIFGAIGFRRVSRHEASNKWQALIGLIAGVVSTVLAIVGIVIIVSSLNKVSKDLNSQQSNISTGAAQSTITADQQRVSYHEHQLIDRGFFIGNY
jgi:hypothetical protein